MMKLLVLLGLAIVAIGAEGKQVVKRAALRSQWLWPDATVAYQFSRNLDYAGKQRLRAAMRHIESKTCIRFKQRRREPSYVRMQYDFKKGSCKANVGYRGNVQDIWIANPKVFKDTGYCGVGSIIHEIGHCLGFFHEQSRPDRDSYVKIDLNNLAPKYKWADGNFDKVDKRWVDARGVGYDYGSLMHYPKGAFAARGKHTIEPLDRNAKIGQRQGLSNGDIQQLNKMYC